MACSIRSPCGGILKLEVKMSTHEVWSCINGHSLIWGQPPSLKRENRGGMRISPYQNRDGVRVRRRR